MAKLGDFAFGLDTAAPQDIARQSQHRWQEHQRIGRKPAQQSTGQGADVITLAGVIYPHFRGGIGQIARMRAMAGQGKPLALIYAFESVGQYNGLWCIRSVNEKRTVFFADGRPRKIEFDLELVEYGADATAVPGQSLVQKIVPSAGNALADSSSVLSAAEAATSHAAALAASARLAGVYEVVADAAATVSGALGLSDAGKVLRTVVRNAGDVKGAVSALKAAGRGIKQAGNSPAAVLDALQGAASAAAGASGVFGAVAGALSDNAGLVNGASAVTQYAKEIGIAAGDFREVATAATNIKSTAKILKGVLGG